MAKAEEAERLQRALHERQPDAHAGDLAKSLGTLSGHLADLGRHGEALVKAEEAERLRRALHARQPEAYGGDLAWSLDNLASHLRALGRHGEALVKAEAAERLRRALHARQPEAHAGDLATSLGNLASHLSDMGRLGEALAKVEEAVRLWRALHARQPDTYASDLAISLSNVAIGLRDLGRHGETLAKAGEAERLRRAFHAREPDAYAGDLAYILTVVGDCQVDAGRPGEALASADEGQEIWASLGRTFTPSENDDFCIGLRVRSAARLATGDTAGAIRDGAASVRGLRASVSKAGRVTYEMVLALVVLAEATSAASDTSATRAVEDAWQAARAELPSRPSLMWRPLARLAAILKDRPSFIDQNPELAMLKNDLAVAEAAWRQMTDRG